MQPYVLLKVNILQRFKELISALSLHMITEIITILWKNHN